MMAYLYGEMSDSDRTAFEKVLEVDKDGQKDLKDFVQLRNLFRQSVDQPMEPIHISLPERKVHSPEVFRKYWWAMAASLLLVAATAAMVGVQMGSSGSQASLMDGGDYITKDDFAQLVQLVTDQKRSLEQYQRQFRTMPAAHENNNAEKTLSREELVRLVRGTIKQEQRDTEYRIASRVMEEQHSNLSSAMQDLRLYLDDQRRQDLQLINGGMQELARTVVPQQDDHIQFVNTSIQK